jgi:hypothetical protein
MQKNVIFIHEFINGYKDSLGMDGAKQLMLEVIAQTGMPYKNDYTKEEALKICYELKKKEGFVGIIGGIFLSRIILR